MADADGATTFSEIEKLERSANQGFDVVVGSRNNENENAIAQVWLLLISECQRAWYRTILMHGFNFLVQTLSGINGLKDTQCGFKLFSRRVARCVFPSLHLERWAFDIEVLYIASRVGYHICVINI